MAGRFQRGGQAGISFFAFQDIITSVIGILLVITILLALHLEPAAPLSTDEAPPAPEQETKLQQTLDTLAALRAEIEQLQAAKSASDPGALAAENTLLKSQIAALKARRSQLRASAKTMTGDRGAEVARAEVARVRTELAAQTAALAEWRTKAAASQAAMVKLEQEVKQREAALLAERDRKNVLRLIPERTKTSKEPVLVLVTGAGLSLQRFDAGEVMNGRSAAQFRDALKQFSKLDQYLVLYFKPSGGGRFDELTEAARDAGFEIGYDAIPEQFEIEFRSTPTPAPAP
jgi:FtsZ-binding cell division protein ZapB